MLISGDMLLPRISTNVSVWPVEPDGDPLRALPRFARRASKRCRRDTLVLPSHGLPFRGIAAARRAAARASRRAAGRARGRRRARRGAGHRRRRACPVLFRRELDLQQRFFAMGEAIAHLNHLWHAGASIARVGADGTIRFVRAMRRAYNKVIRKDPFDDRNRYRGPAQAGLRPRRARRLARHRRRQERQAARRLRSPARRSRAPRSPATSSASPRRSWSWPRRCWPIPTASPRRR